MDKRGLSESDICAKFITPHLQAAGWNESRIRREVFFTKGRIIVRGKLVTRGKAKRADYILYHKPNHPIAIIEAKDNGHSLGAGMQQAVPSSDNGRRGFCVSSLFGGTPSTNSACAKSAPVRPTPRPSSPSCYG